MHRTGKAWKGKEKKIPKSKVADCGRFKATLKMLSQGVRRALLLSQNAGSWRYRKLKIQQGNSTKDSKVGQRDNHFINECYRRIIRELDGTDGNRK